MADSKTPQTGGGPSGPGAGKGARPKAQTINLPASEVTGKPAETPKAATAEPATSSVPSEPLAPQPDAPEQPTAAKTSATASVPDPKPTTAATEPVKPAGSTPDMEPAIRTPDPKPATGNPDAKPGTPAAAAASAGVPGAGRSAPSMSSRSAEPPRPTAPSTYRPSNGGGGAAGALGWLFAALAGAGLAVLAVYLLQDRLIRVPEADMSRVMASEQNMDRLRRDLTALNQRVNQFAESSDPRPLAAKIDAIDGRVGAVDSRLGTLDTRLGGYDGRVGALNQTVEGAAGRVSGLDADVKNLRDRIANLPPDPAVGVLTGRIEGIEYRIQSLPTLNAMEVMATRVENAERRAAQAAARDDLAALDQRVAAVGGLIPPLDARLSTLGAALRTLPKGDPAARLVVAVAALDRALQEGRPFTSELSTVKTTAGDSVELAALDPFAASGLPTRPALSQELSATLAKLEPLKGPPQGGVLERFVANAGGVMSITPKDAAEGSEPSALRAKLASLAQGGDIEQALALRGKLDEAARAATEDWSRKASARIAAESAVGSARTAALARLAAND